MGIPEHEKVEKLLRAIRDGDEAAVDQLFAVVYDELRYIADRKLLHEKRHEVMNVTSLVHEAYLKLARDEVHYWENRRHFFAAAAEAMRRILVDKARRQRRTKRRGGESLESLGGDVIDRKTRLSPDELLDLNDALGKLEKLDRRKAQVVKFRFFLGLSIEETAEHLGIAIRTINADWDLSKAWLKREMTKGDTPR